MTILMTGGGTLGSVTPLLAVGKSLEKIYPWIKIVWVGTHHGPEKELVEKFGYRFISITVTKLPRYISLKIFTAPFVLFWSYFQARRIIVQEKPDMIMSAGSYVSVPMIWAGKVSGIKTWIHQLDVRPGLANKLMSPFADRITTSWQKSLAVFSAERATWLGTPVRADLRATTRDAALRNWKINPDLPTIFVVGGGTGALGINRVIQAAAPKLLEKANIIHLLGKNKMDEEALQQKDRPGRYFSRDFILDMDQVYTLADVVVCRAGMGTLSELAFLSKAAVVISMPNSHQKDNAAELQRNDAAVIYEQHQPLAVLERAIGNLLADELQRKKIGQNLCRLMPTEEVSDQIAEQIRTELSSNNT